MDYFRYTTDDGCGRMPPKVAQLQLGGHQRRDNLCNLPVKLRAAVEVEIK